MCDPPESKEENKERTRNLIGEGGKGPSKKEINHTLHDVCLYPVRSTFIAKRD